MPHLIRPALAVDRDRIAALHTASWQDSYRGVLPDHCLGPELAGQHLALWQKIFADPVPGRLLLVATRKGAVEGFIASLPDRDDPGRDFIAALHVSPEARGHGIGARLMREWSDRLAAIGRTRAWLIVAEQNTRARAFYRRLGGVEGEVFLDALSDHDETPALPVAWEDIAGIGVLARAEPVRRQAPPAMLRMAEVKSWSGASHPVAAAEQAAKREKQVLGTPFGLTDFGVNRVTLAPGCHSTVSHYHSHEDEWICVLEGNPSLIRDGIAHELSPGDCAGFPAGTGPSHVIVNTSDRNAVYLEIGTRRQDLDRTTYPGEDLRVATGSDGDPWFLRLDGTALARAT